MNGRYLINPGTHRLTGTVAHADARLQELMRETGAERMTLRGGSDDQGYYRCELSRGEVTVHLRVPGVPRHRVVNDNPFACSRIYVEGDSWLWKYAVNQIKLRFAGEYA